MFGRDAATLRVLRAASAPARTDTTGWAKELATVSIFDLVQSITSISAAADIIDRGLRVSLNGINELHIPSRVLNAAAAGQWVQEGGVIPVRQLSFADAAVLRPRKLVVLMSFTREQIESSNIEAIVQQTMGEAAGIALDAQLLSATAGDATKPPGLFVGVTGLVPVAGGGDNAMHGDLANLFGALAANGAGKGAIIVAALPQAVRLKMSVGPKWDYDIISSTALASGTVAAIEVASFVSGFSAVPEFGVSRDATVHMEGATPADWGTPMKSMFQTDSSLLKMNLSAAWGVRAVGHVQFITGCTW